MTRRGCLSPIMPMIHRPLSAIQGFRGPLQEISPFLGHIPVHSPFTPKILSAFMTVDRTL